MKNNFDRNGFFQLGADYEISLMYIIDNTVKPD